MMKHLKLILILILSLLLVCGLVSCSKKDSKIKDDPNKRYRGVMYDLTNEDELKTLSQEWNGNLIRWWLCHQQVNGSFLPVTAYPGTINGVYYDKTKLKEILQPVRDFQVKYGVRIYVGEFSAVRWASGAAQYLEDCIAIFEEYGWDWSYHAYKNWTGWDLEHDNGTSNSPIVIANERTDRMEVVLAGLALNNK
ncbi:MAG: hypothetical protein ACM3YE_00860 [Bacteroidota bacterium]